MSAADWPMAQVLQAASHPRDWGAANRTIGDAYGKALNK
jgi:hypothetical protein